MDDLLESMWREQLGEEAAAEAVATSESSSSFDSDLDEPPAAAAGQHSLWRPDVQPGRAVRRHVRRLERAQTVDLGAEIQRHKAMASLTVFFLNRVNRSLNLELRIPPFERWAASQHPVEGKGADPVLPDPRVQDSIFGRRLLARELVESGAGKHEVRRLLKDLDKTAVKLLGQLHRSTGDASGSVGGGSVKVTFEAAKGRYVLQYKGLALACNKTHYDKLRALFERCVNCMMRYVGVFMLLATRRALPSPARITASHSSNDNHTRHGAVGPSPSTAAAQQAFHHRNDQEQARDRRFHHAALAVLLRYSSVAGGTDRGGGFQGAINEEVFEVLLRCMDCRTECFASPLNCRYGRFCSAFYDTDAAFGSLGSFFDFHPTEVGGCARPIGEKGRKKKEWGRIYTWSWPNFPAYDECKTQGCFEANPPFTPSVMQRMAAHMEALLEASEEEQSDGQGEQKPLAFVVIIPAWDEAHNDRAIQQASARSWKRCVVVVSSSSVHKGGGSCTVYA